MEEAGHARSTLPITVMASPPRRMAQGQARKPTGGLEEAEDRGGNSGSRGGEAALTAPSERLGHENRGLRKEVGWAGASRRSSQTFPRVLGISVFLVGLALARRLDGSAV